MGASIQTWPPPAFAPKELHIQRWLRAGLTLAPPGLTTSYTETEFTGLTDRYAIKATRHKRYPNLVLFKYNQIESPFAEPLVQECRGIILDQAANWKVVAMPYQKFFNHGEPLAHPIDWSLARVQEKLDGSLMTLYHYRDEWHVSTSGVPDAETNVGDVGLNFKELFWQTFKSEGLMLSQFVPGFCYMFELCAPENRIVVQHRDRRLYLHGIRDLQTLRECYVSETEMLMAGIRMPRSYPLRDINDCIKAAQELNPLQNEGFVVCDDHFRRVKVKSPQYLLLHHAKDGLLSRRRLADLVRKGEGSELLASFPEFRPAFDELQVKYDSLVSEAGSVYGEIRELENQKEFALAAQKNPKVQSILFAMRKQGCTPQQYLAGMFEPAYLRIMEVKE